jgi:hypothetical protein
MLDPLAKRLVLTQRPPNTESKITSVRVHESRCNATIAAMAVNQRQLRLTHLPSLSQNMGKNPVEHDLSRMVAMKIDFHLALPVRWAVEANGVS